MDSFTDTISRADKQDVLKYIDSFTDDQGYFTDDEIYSTLTFLQWDDIQDVLNKRAEYWVCPGGYRDQGYSKIEKLSFNHKIFKEDDTTDLWEFFGNQEPYIVVTPGLLRSAKAFTQRN
tara:strand:+ start:109 stop:465 length:357 start_codon:yes stop_codon:yes gene_type:complete